MARSSAQGFYENFWQDSEYQLAYAFDSAVRDRFPAIRRVWGGLQQPKTAADFGCGNGVLSYWMHCNGFAQQITGVDISQKGIDYANTTFARPGLTFQRAAGLDALAELKPLDVVISSHVLEHLPDPELGLAKLRPLASWFVFEVPLERALAPSLHSLLTGRPQQNNPVGHVNFWTKTSFQELLRRNGFLIVRDFHYASAPFSPYTAHWKRALERTALGLLGVAGYASLLATHYCVLAWAGSQPPPA
jgi:hypothetical protein